ncbi:MAG: hypothetical protein AAGU76_16070 [Sedimentibacter sp.]|uniref:hypothetical protein n=1 Tax=Sedimentibacter sp. TaxID=1960295 RepID=UPI00315803A1
MDFEKLIELAVPVLTVIFGALAAYLKTNEKILNRSIQYIAEAEEMYKDVSKAGGQKFSWVVDTLYNMVPSPLKIVFTKKCIEKIVQATFNGIEAYAKTQIDKAVDRYMETKENTAGKKSKTTQQQNSGERND